MTNYRLGLRINSNSIGWCALSIKENGAPIDMLDWGVRVFNNGRTPDKKGIPGEPLAMGRTQARLIRRGYQRRKMRQKNVSKQLSNFGLFPEDKESQTPLIKILDKLKFRNNAISQKLEPYQIGCAIFHLQQSRGFKSNRKDAQQSSSKELTGMKLGINNLEKVLGDKYTLGQFLYKRNSESMVSTKFQAIMGEKNKLIYDFYISRQMVENEFNAIWEQQKKYYPELLHGDAYKAIHKAIFYQRPLKPQPKGKCAILSYDTRIEWAMPSAQHFRIIKEINTLDFTAPASIKDIRLNAEQRKKLYNELCLRDSLTFKQINKVLGLSSAYEFNLDTNGRDRLKGDSTAKLMRNDKCFGAAWDNFNIKEQDIIIGNLLNSDSTNVGYMDDETLIDWLCKNYKLTGKQAEEVLNAPLPGGVCAYGKTVITSILPKMINEGIFENHAISSCGWKPYATNIRKIYNELPYYGEVIDKYVVKNENSADKMVSQFGRISNPSLHIAMNQLRRLMNKLKKRYDSFPQEIVIQVDRNLKKGTKEITKIAKHINADIKRRDKWRNEIERYNGGEATNNDYLKMKLWEELAEDITHRKCIYSGRTISMSMLFSDEVQVSYILPYSKTLDNTSANLTIITLQGAYIKGNKTPYEAFSDQSEEYSYEKILERSRSMPKSKQWRFRADAMEIFKNKTQFIQSKSGLDEDIIETELDAFAVRPLRDTEYVSKLIKKYLGYACKKGVYGVTATPGNLTGLIKGAWGLSDLLPNKIPDHRRNAVDALAISLTTYFTVRKIADAAALEERKGIRIMKTLGNENPYLAFDWEKLQEKLNIVVAHEPNRGTTGKLHEDTYYGKIGEEDNNLIIDVRKPLSNITKFKDIDSIKDTALKQSIREFIGSRTDIEESIKEFQASPDCRKIAKWGVRNAKILDKKNKNIMVVVNKEHNMVAQGGSNHHAEIYCIKEMNKWQVEVISTFNANQKDFIPKWKIDFPDAKQIMTLHINDIVAYDDNGKTEIKRVKKILTQGIIFLTPHFIAREQADQYSWGASARQMQIKNARHVLVECDGSLYDKTNQIVLKN